MSRLLVILGLCIASAIVKCGAASLPKSGSWIRSASNATQVGTLALDGITDCGVARIVDIRFSGCTNAPCQVQGGNVMTLEVDFMPRDMHWDMEHRGIVLKDTELVLLSEGPLSDSTVHPGNMYTFTYPITIPRSFSGRSDIRLKVFQNYVHEICLVLPINIG